MNLVYKHAMPSDNAYECLSAKIPCGKACGVIRWGFKIEDFKDGRQRRAPNSRKKNKQINKDEFSSHVEYEWTRSYLKTC